MWRRSTLAVAPLQVPLCHGHGEILAPGEAALLLPPPPRVQPPLPLQMQRLCLQPLHTGEHCSPPGSRCKGGLVQLTALLPAGCVSAGGMPVMPSHPGLFQHLGCCMKVPGVHSPLEEQLGPSGQLTRRFLFFNKLFSLSFGLSLLTAHLAT